MPKPRKPLRIGYAPPTKKGWYAYSHAGQDFEAVYLDDAALQNAQDRYDVSRKLDIPFVDVWSRRMLKKRERGARL